MRSVKDRVPSKTSIFGITEKNYDQTRKSFDFLEKTGHLIFLRNQTIYRKVKKPLLGFKEGLYFVHKDKSPRKMRQKSQTATYSRSLKDSPVPQLTESLKVPTPVIYINTKPRSSTPLVKEIQCKTTEGKSSDVSRPVKPKIIIKRKAKTKPAAKSAFKDSSNITKDFGELDPWDLTNDASYFSGFIE